MIRAILITQFLTLIGFSALSCVEDNGRETIDTDTEQAAPIEVIDPCRAEQDVEFSPIENFEYGIATQWWVSTDGTGTVNHMVGREPSAEELETGRCGYSKYALHIVAEGLEIFGGAFGLNFYLDPHDMSEWDGISMWNKRTENSGRSLFFGVSDKYTDEYNGKLLFEDNTPYCLEITDDESLKCDRFGAGVGMDTKWRFVKIPFSEMRQRGYGMPAPELDVSAILGFNIGFESGDWDFWIDDVAFYREKQ